VSPSSEPIEEEQVVLGCRADRLLYWNLAWFRLSDDTSTAASTAASTALVSGGESSSPSVRPCRSLPLAQAAPQSGVQGGAKLSLDLRLDNVSRGDEGTYACQVENIKTREKTCLLHTLTLRGTRGAALSGHAHTHTHTLTFIVSLLPYINKERFNNSPKD